MQREQKISVSVYTPFDALVGKLSTYETRQPSEGFEVSLKFKHTERDFNAGLSEVSE
jgi:hypothetical protein